jgi:hypothetical protein
MTRCVLGIDPGREGAVVALRGTAAEAALLPSTDAGLDGRALVATLRSLLGDDDQPYVVVERAQSFPGQGVASSFRYGRDYGRILGVLDAIGWPYETVPPAVWHRAVVGGSGVDPKARARAVVEARLPWLELRPGKRRKAHEGIVDAACLALYGLEVRRG